MASPSPAPAAVTAPKITALDLCALTGLTDRRHRQLAADGYFPPPVESQYVMLPTIRGLFKYYREHNQRTKEKIIGTKDRKTQMEMRLLKLKFDRETERSMLRSDVDRMLAYSGALMTARLYTALEREFPGRVVGRSPAEISALGRALADELIGFLRDFPEQLKTHPPE